MPKSGLLSCSIEIGETNTRLREYGTRFFDRTVETYVAIPNKPTPFSIRLATTSYIAPGLSVWIYIDGVYQTNRNKRGAQPPDGKFEFHLGQKEALLKEGRVIARGWSFEKLNIVNGDPKPTVNDDVTNNLGNIEVVVLRCEDDQDNEPIDPWAFQHLPTLESIEQNSESHETRTTQRKRREKKNKPPSVENDDGGDMLGGLFGIFDGAGDEPRHRHVRFGRYDGHRDRGVSRRSLDDAYIQQNSQPYYDEADDHDTITSSDEPYGSSVGYLGAYLDGISSSSEFERARSVGMDHRRSRHDHRGHGVYDASSRSRRHNLPSLQHEELVRNSDQRASDNETSRTHHEYTPTIPNRHECNDLRHFSSVNALEKSERKPHIRTNPSHETRFGSVRARPRKDKHENLHDSRSHDGKSQASSPLAQLYEYRGTPIKEYISPYQVVQIPSAHQSASNVNHDGSCAILPNGQSQQLPREPPHHLQYSHDHLWSEAPPPSAVTPVQYPQQPPASNWQQAEALRRAKIQALQHQLRELECVPTPAPFLPKSPWPSQPIQYPVTQEIGHYFTVPAENPLHAMQPDNNAYSVPHQMPTHQPGVQVIPPWWWNPGGKGTRRDARSRSSSPGWDCTSSSSGSQASQGNDNKSNNGWGNGNQDKDSGGLVNAENTIDNNQQGGDNDFLNSTTQIQDPNESGWPSNGNDETPNNNNNPCNDDSNDNWSEDNEKNDDSNGNNGWKNQDNGNGWPSNEDTKEIKKSRPSPSVSSEEEKPYTRSYWHMKNATQPETPDANSGRKRDRYTMPEDPIYTISEDKAKSEHLKHQVRGGKGTEQEKRTYRPIYWDSMEEPYAVFRFKYRSRDMLKKILGEDISESKEEFKEWLNALSKEQLVAEMMRKKDTVRSDSDDDEGSTKGEEKKKSDRKAPSNNGNWDTSGPDGNVGGGGWAEMEGKDAPDGTW